VARGILKSTATTCSRPVPASKRFAWGEHDTRIDLLLTDIVMPKACPPGLAKNCAGKHDLKVLYSSGYSIEVAARTSAHDGMAFLKKPYQPSLAQKVRECLDLPAKFSPCPPPIGPMRPIGP